jgi:Protein of unknown function (DUF2924)
MARSTTRRQPAIPPAVADFDAELERITTLGVEDLRALWRERQGQAPPEALSKDLIARALAHFLQEERLGGLASPLRKLLASISEKGAEPVRGLKVGSVIVREYQGKLHEVMVVPEGFLWQGQVYASLSAVALKITGTSWSGRRFFGLCDGADAGPSSGAGREPSPTKKPCARSRFGKSGPSAIPGRTAAGAPAAADPSHSASRCVPISQLPRSIERPKGAP